MPLKRLFGQATGIGSLPHTDPAAALRLIFSTLKGIPHWPQLPRRNKAEGFVTQYLAPLLKQEVVAVDGSGSPYFCTAHPRWEERCLRLLELLLDRDGSPEEFAFPPASAAGFYAFLKSAPEIAGEAVCFKGQLSGPVTVGFQVRDEDGSPSFYNPSLREILVKTLAAQARWQVRRLKTLGRPVLLFIDDPGLYGYGTSGAVALGRADIQAALGEIIEGIRAEGGLAGAHCCAGTDWSLLLELPLDLVSFDAYHYFPSMQVYADELDRFLSRGGALGWGIVPTGEAAYREDAASLHQLMDKQMATLVKQGVDENRLYRQAVITPSCGTGTLSVELAERIYRLTAALIHGDGSSGSE